jgi:hypothetical protein
MTPIFNIIIELSCLIAALFFLRNDTSKFSCITISYLAVVCITEVLGLLYIKTFHQSNAWIYNIFIIFEATYIAYGLYVALKALTNRAVLICSLPLIIFCCTYVFEIFNHGFLKFQTLTITIESVLFVFVSLIYFYLLIKQKDPINLKIHPQYWWITAVLFYYFGSTIYNLFIYFLYKDFPKSYDILIYIMLGLNLLLYSIWIYSFLCNSRQRKLLSLLP